MAANACSTKRLAEMRENLEHLDELEDAYLAEQRLIDNRAGRSRAYTLGQRESTRRFTTFESARRHEAERTFIENELANAADTGTTAVVITHHAPTPRSVAPRFHGDPCNAAFASDLEAVISQYQPALWIHGHMHDPVDITIGRTRVLCNPAGYDAAANERRGYSPQLCVRVGG